VTTMQGSFDLFLRNATLDAQLSKRVGRHKSLY
jgi:hypothetical protein